MSNKVSSVAAIAKSYGELTDNQQGSYFLIKKNNPSETTRRSPLEQKVLSKGEAYAYLHGAMHDASLNKVRRIRFGQKYPEWLNTIKGLLQFVGENSWMYKEGKNRDFYILETVCKNLDFTFNPVTLTINREKVAYIRGFFDAEGGIPRTSKEFYIQLVQKNFRKMETLKKMLGDLGIYCGKIHNPSKRADPNYWRIFISRNSHKDFASIVGSWHPIKAKIFSERMMI